MLTLESNVMGLWIAEHTDYNRNGPLKRARKLRCHTLSILKQNLQYNSLHHSHFVEFLGTFRTDFPKEWLGEFDYV
jgi:hypothetical protein